MVRTTRVVTRLAWVAFQEPVAQLALPASAGRSHRLLHCAAMTNDRKTQELLDSDDMEPIAGTVDVAVPVAELWRCFRRADWWPRWASCFFSAKNRDLVKGEKLVWAFNAIRWWYPYKMPASANIVEVEPESKVTWEVTVLPGFYARHTYSVEDLGDGRTRFGSWEKARGWNFRLFKGFWKAHFRYVRDTSLEGAKLLEKIYQDQGNLDLSDRPKLPARGPLAARLLALLALVALLGAGAAGIWFHRSYVRQTPIELAPGVHAVLGGGGNSLVVEGDDEILLVDPKFPPGSRSLAKWLSRRSSAPVTRVVNTHYHYDHTQGNALYTEAEIIAHARVPEFMLDGANPSNAPDWWERHPGAVPTVGVDERRRRLTVGPHEVVLEYPGPGHTRGDLVVVLPKAGIVATGDLLFHTYYPFFDLTDHGVSLPGQVEALRRLARRHPDATFVPGHGPLARAEDLERFADYVAGLHAAVETAYRQGLSETATVAAVGVPPLELSPLPSVLGMKFKWATRASNVRWVYRYVAGSDTAKS